MQRRMNVKNIKEDKSGFIGGFKKRLGRRRIFIFRIALWAGLRRQSSGFFGK